MAVITDEQQQPEVPKGNIQPDILDLSV